MIFLQLIRKEIFNSWEFYFFVVFMVTTLLLMHFKPNVLLAIFRIPRNLFINLKKDKLPDWAKAPQWARYVAQDCTGTWRWHFRKPKLVNGVWVSASMSKYDHAGYSKIFEKSFENSLQEKPK